MGFVGSDLWKVRQKWGTDLLLWVGSTVIPVTKDGKIWLGRRADTADWAVSGGHFELGDSAENCARREIAEELGTEILNLTMIGVISDPKLTYIKHPNGDEAQAPSFVFIAEIDEGHIVLDEEHVSYEWLDLDEAKLRVADNERRYSPVALAMYGEWLRTKEFQVR